MRAAFDVLMAVAVMAGAGIAYQLLASALEYFRCR